MTTPEKSTVRPSPPVVDDAELGPDPIAAILRTVSDQWHAGVLNDTQAFAALLKTGLSEAKARIAMKTLLLSKPYG